MSKKEKNSDVGLTLTIMTTKSHLLRKKLIDSGCDFEELKSNAITGLNFFKVYNYNELLNETPGSLCDFCDKLNGITK